MKAKSIIALLVAAVMAVTLAGCGGAQKTDAPKFPTKQIEIIVPYAAGGGTDQVARALANSAKDIPGQPVVVVNKVGGGGAVGMSEGEKAKPDGYTVTMITVELVTLPHLGLAPINYQNFEPILRVNMDPAAVTVRADAPWKTLKEFLDYAKANPGKVRVGNSGPGAIWHLAAASLEQKTGVQFTHVPFNGAAPAVTALLGGNVEAVTVSPAEVSAQVAAGQVRVLGVMSDKRAKAVPDVPTLKEQGIDLVIGTWRGLAVPKGTPAPVVKTLHDAFKKAMDSKAFTDYMDKAGLGIGYLSSEDYKASLKVENDNFKALIEKLGLNKKQ
ncbi:Uncharacterized protein UPF0065 [Thermosinus carboxydivorans Nor1]|uniref:Uncharacterized protein UPF0065 n=1 Tax=Thermosinus carboxydivorans Nor1 TaxID=401526 RepID=A1HM22_9FIRM|nr:tripartite tricarboxylate transporter substrate binding protein [Thermosinus carboxydivorans]EAX48873.1 Uncharacterized protein UPF0065 [Thermosinus carboxydivorans Nor1]